MQASFRAMPTWTIGDVPRPLGRRYGNSSGESLPHIYSHVDESAARAASAGRQRRDGRDRSPTPYLHHHHGLQLSARRFVGKKPRHMRPVPGLLIQAIQPIVRRSMRECAGRKADTIKPSGRRSPFQAHRVGATCRWRCTVSARNCFASDRHPALKIA